MLALFNTSGINVKLNRWSGDIHSNPLKKLCKQPRTPVVRTDRPSIITPQNSLDISYGSLEWYIFTHWAPRTVTALAGLFTNQVLQQSHSRIWVTVSKTCSSKQVWQSRSVNQVHKACYLFLLETGHTPFI